MLKPDEMIPIEVIEAYLEAVEHGCGAYEVLSRAINAWPGMNTGPNIYGRQDAIIHLPLPQEGE